MEIRTILVNLDIDSFSPSLVKCASSLAKRFNADLVGMSAAQPSPALVGVEGSVAVVGWYEQEREDIEERLRSNEAQFRSVAPAGLNVDWRAFIDTPARGVASAARCADLIVTASHTAAGGMNHQRCLDVGELILTAGRPVLVVGTGVEEIKGDKIVVGFKDTREARRAISDALPFLKAASEVVAVTISEGDISSERTSLNDVLAWLRRHDVKARGDVYSDKDGAADMLEATSRLLESDLVVTGGYGHSRLREWLFGGMTRELLATSGINRFMSN
jgi:nucleotide-binding universal stress UspA family protein